MNEELNNDYNGDKVSQEHRTSREISNDNLIRFKPGQSGNPGGKQAGKSITAELRKLINSGTNAEDMAQILYNMCKRMSPDQMRALKELLDRTDGKVMETHKVELDVPVTIIFKPAGEDATIKEEKQG